MPKQKKIMLLGGIHYLLPVIKAANIYGRRYFYPLITAFDPYKDYPSATPENLPVATKIANQVICLPMHHALSEEDVERVVNCIVK